MTAIHPGVASITQSTTYVRRHAAVAGIAIVLFAGLQIAASFGNPDPVVQDLWREDLIAQVVAGLLAAGVALFVGRWAARRNRRGQLRGVSALAITALLLGPLVWWSAAPVVLAAGAITLGQVTGATEPDGGSRLARGLAMLSGLVAAATVTVLIVSILVNLF